MLKKLSVSLLGLLLALTAGQTVQAETVLEKAARTGQLTLGVNLNRVPFSYVNDKNELVGYSLDVVELIRREVSSALGKEIQLIRVEAPDVTAAIPKLLTGEIDLACDTAFTWERNRYVDFTVSYGVTGLQLLAQNNLKVESPADLAGKKIAVVPNSVAEKALKAVQPKATIVPVPSLQEGAQALKTGKVDGVAGDGLLLRGLKLTEGLDSAKLVPEKAYTSYGIGCMVAQNNPAFLRLANQAIVRLAEGYVFGDPEPTALINRWFGPQGVLPVESERIRSFFNFILVTHEQVPKTDNR
ncbi:MAG: transporter substrate-binding domain-containing protein [Cyanobacteria bacterium RI_101]|nr:transporter substrate-binding domain-containing protein [Cyanobacteria bacterium RI_101]